MSEEAVGDFIYSLPVEKDGDDWSGRIKSIGGKVQINTTYRKCNYVTYFDSDIVDTLMFEGEMVHKLWYQNIIKIEGVY